MATRYTVQPGDGIESIAEAHGFYAATIWDHPDNADLRKLRKDPSVLAPGDELTIPDPRQKKVQLPTGKKHVFKRRGVPVLFRMQLRDEEDEPHAHARFELVIDGVSTNGHTDDKGWLEQWIPPRAGQATLRLPDNDEEYELQFGQLDPIDTDAGARARLRHLGYLGDDDDADAVAAAIAHFQHDQALEPTQQMDDATRDRLVEVHGS